MAVAVGGLHPLYAMRLGACLGRALESERPLVVLAKDPRQSSYMLEAALQAGLSASGADVLLASSLPEPGLRYLTRTFHADAGVMIGAANMPHPYSDLTLFDGNGAPYSTEQRQAVEPQLDQPLMCVSSDRLGKATKITDAVGRYVEYCKSRFSAGVALKGIGVLVDTAHGACHKVAPKVLTELGAQVTLRRGDPNGFNINNQSLVQVEASLADAMATRSVQFALGLNSEGSGFVLLNDCGMVIADHWKDEQLHCRDGMVEALAELSRHLQR
ncbi:hypothetical protein [Ferrimonas pelagia]